MKRDIVTKLQADELTDAELDAVAGGYESWYKNDIDYFNPIQQAADYWCGGGFVGTLQDFAWQVMN